MQQSQLRFSLILAIGAFMVGSGNQHSVPLVPAQIHHDGGNQPDFTADQFLLGRWRCTLQGVHGNRAREDATYRMVLNGRWLQLDYVLHPASGSDIATTAYETFDSGLGKWVYISISSNGHHGVTYSDGWKNGVKLYLPDSTPATFQVKVTKVNEREITESLERRSSEGKMLSADVLKCRKID